MTTPRESAQPHTPACPGHDMHARCTYSRAPQSLHSSSSTSLLSTGAAAAPYMPPLSPVPFTLENPDGRFVAEEGAAAALSPPPVGSATCFGGGPGLGVGLGLGATTFAGAGGVTFFGGGGGFFAGGAGFAAGGAGAEAGAGAG
eukprot:CAMPEP_0119543012 /NCGR_PEP_ID=MMETSP1344-20130328/53900_1 /TAXON_ID=236787 /ORGANISM="Florenciella parvula, Strain CCMP2471" /LENGTH=143 /DNA_ID=CAMNT_0007587285 /DNA_START=90 /DNA_END=518 /DNA_ORIENTATION=+